jgi:hypothetical protein
VLRRTSLTAAGALLLLIGAVSASGRPSADDLYIGDWKVANIPGYDQNTPWKNGGTITVTSASRAQVNAFPNAKLDCDGTNNSITVGARYLLTYDWGNGQHGTMGGCSSSVSQGYPHFWGIEGSVPGKPDGELHAGPSACSPSPCLHGYWIDHDGPFQSFAGFQSAKLRFGLAAKGRRALPKGAKGRHVFELVNATGLGELTFDSPPNDGGSQTATDAVGAIKFHRWRIGGPKLIEEESLLLEVMAARYDPAYPDHAAFLQVRVKKTDPHETDACPVGFNGSVYISTSVKTPDELTINICHLKESYVDGERGAKVEVQFEDETSGG